MSVAPEGAALISEFGKQERLKKNLVNKLDELRQILSTRSHSDAITR
ncbi:MAG: hypothetical protein ACI80L_000146 [Pseudohongiellaceae bacterium]|jgi:hypothetical protein